MSKEQGIPQAFDHPFVSGAPVVGIKLQPGTPFNKKLDREGSRSGVWRTISAKDGEIVPNDPDRFFIRLERPETTPEYRPTVHRPAKDLS